MAIPLEQLRICLLQQRKQHDFDEFWAALTARNSRQPLNPAAEPVTFRITEARVEKVSFDAFDGGRITGWSIAPANMKPHPTLLFFQDYAVARPAPAKFLAWTLLGFTCMAFDTRGQQGESSDCADYGAGRGPGWLTSGLEIPDRYYIARCYIDAARAVEFAATCIEVDPKRIGVAGVGQGGAMALAAAALDHRTAMCMAATPAFCHFGDDPGALSRMPCCAEIADWLETRPQLAAAAWRTISYVELNNLASRVKCPALLNAALPANHPALPGIFSTANRIKAKDKVVDMTPAEPADLTLTAEPAIAFARRLFQPKRK